MKRKNTKKTDRAASRRWMKINEYTGVVFTGTHFATYPEVIIEPCII